jgi:hypothetical protein
MDDEALDRVLSKLASVRAQCGGRSETECVSRQHQVERETRPTVERERFRDWYQRVQDCSHERVSDWSGSSWSGQGMSGRGWGGGRER